MYQVPALCAVHVSPLLQNVAAVNSAAMFKQQYIHRYNVQST